MSVSVESIRRTVEVKSGFVARLRQEIGRVIVGQQYMVDRLLAGMLANGHVLVEGVPGLAKTTAVKALAQALDCAFRRIQFTPDLLPADLIGTLVYNPKDGGFSTKKGPIFGNIILADEINRAPAKVQSALLEAMQERQVTIGETTFKLEEPFMVLATQNPIEQEGTYPLPEAQLDRFMFMVTIDYPPRDEERMIVKHTTRDAVAEPRPVLTAEEILKLQQIVRKIPVSDHVVDYAVNLVRATRPGEEGSPPFVGDWLTWGAGPRAAQYLVLGAKARAILQGRFNVSCNDIRGVALPVLRHRIFTNFNADAEGIKPEDVVRRLLETIAEPTAAGYAARA